ncbi:uncharacterized protein [Watersipora subatra]|uniref:uncharacterized protein n=1 Tax=Watersipora subatra TaxID=2589382 RepID=UPI00355C0367
MNIGGIIGGVIGGLCFLIFAIILPICKYVAMKKSSDRRSDAKNQGITASSMTRQTQSNTVIPATYPQQLQVIPPSPDTQASLSPPPKYSSLYLSDGEIPKPVQPVQATDCTSAQVMQQQ